MPEIGLFKSEEKQSRSAAANFLRALADKVETGKVVLKQPDKEVVLELPPQLTLEVKAEREEKVGRPEKLSLEVELEWTPGEAGSGASGVELG